MARGKKKEQLSLEERLEQALVPAGEQPYQVPGNWCWVAMENLVDLHRGVSYKKNQGHSNKCENDCLVLRGGNILEGAIDIEAENIYVDKSLIKSEQFIQENDIIIVSSTGSKKVIGRAGISFTNYSDMSFGAFLMLARPKEQPCKRYVNYYFQSQIYRERIRLLASGVNINNIRAEYIMKSPVPLPPMQEQQRIVDRIERMFAQLDEAKEKITEVKESYLARKAAILSQAFTGKLTTAWRHKNNVENNWALKTFGEVAVIKSNLVKPNEYRDFPHIAPDNIEKRTGMLLQYNTIAEDGVTSGKHRFYPGQILYSKIRPYLSKVVMVDFNGLCSADMYPIEAKENTRYLWYYMLSDDFLNQASSAGSRSVLPKINQKELSKLVIAMPGIEEQKEVVKILDRLLPYEQHVLEYVEDVLEKIDLLKKSILSKAFRGQLGTNHPEEESAMELLKSILMEP